MKTVISLGREIKSYLFLFCIFNTNLFVMNAQGNFCGTIIEDNPTIKNLWSQVDQNAFPTSFHDEPPLVLKVHFWDILPEIGSSPHPRGETTALNAVAQLNRNFNAFNIFFKYDGIDSFVSGEYYVFEEETDGYTMTDFLYINGYYIEGAVNIFSLHEYVGGPLAGWKGAGNGVFSYIICEYNEIDTLFAPMY